MNQTSIDTADLSCHRVSRKVSVASLPGARIKDIRERVGSAVRAEAADEVLVVHQVGVCDLESATGDTVLKDLVDLAVSTKSPRPGVEVRVAAVPERFDRGWVVWKRAAFVNYSLI